MSMTADERNKLIPDTTLVVVVAMICSVVTYLIWCSHDETLHHVDVYENISLEYDVRNYTPKGGAK